jgi:hypothetical protein
MNIPKFRYISNLQNLYFCFNIKVKQMQKILFLLIALLVGFNSCRKIPNNPEIPPRDPSALDFYHFYQARTVVAGEYIIDGHYFINNTMTIEAGAKFLFTERGSLTVKKNGKIIANGVAGNPIEFKSKSDTKGGWVGLTIQAGSTGSVFNYTNFRHGGLDVQYGVKKIDINKAVINLYGSASFANCSFADCAGTSLNFKEKNSNGQLLNFGSIASWQKNIITNCDGLALIIPAHLMTKLDANSNFTNNKYNYILFESTKIADSNDVVFYKNDATYINSFNYFTMKPATTNGLYRSVLANAGAKILIGDLNAIIKMDIIGTSADPVMIDGNIGNVGLGLGRVSINASSGVTIQHAVFKDIKLIGIIGGTNWFYNLIGNANISIKDITISNSFGTGLIITGQTYASGVQFKLIDLDNITIKNCNGHPMVMHGGNMVGSGFNFSGNQFNTILLNTYGEMQDDTLKNFGYDYEINIVPNVNSYSELRMKGNSMIEAGVKIKTTYNIYPIVFEGNLLAEGTAAQPIEFYSTAADFQQAMQIGSCTGKMTNCNFKGFGAGQSPNLNINSSSILLKNCTFSNTTSCGVKATNSPLWDDGGNTMNGTNVLVCP